MVSSAPVASPTLIICVTMAGNTFVSFKGAEIVSPRSMLVRVTITASSTIELPEVFAVISRPSRIGTPELINVDNVRQNRATAIFRRMFPSTGAFSIAASTTRRPASVT